MSRSMVAPNVLSWASDVEAATVAQAARSAAMPFVRGHVALMPDAHLGIGATVGSVIPTRGAVMPAAVGVDIGCGMIAARTDLTAADLPDSLDGLMPLVARAIPAGVGQGHADRSAAFASAAATWPARAMAFTARQEETAATQFGTLGSGNHFVEVCLDQDDVVWTVLHSGSRGIGNQIATIHIEGARALMARYFITLDDPDLAYLVQGTAEFDSYIADMLWAQAYAMGNREAMQAALTQCLFSVVGKGAVVDTINCHHNFTQLEHHGRQDLWITRKGAIRARSGDRGVIPGSMGTRSYIVSGLGSTAAYQSCSHGAGRRMSRSQARRSLSTESLVAAMGERSWNRDDAAALLDEHPLSYKDIDQVMADQADLVTVTHTLRQVFNYKGTG
ncbi:MAG: RtcB family protein [Actinomycetota bacterium]|nr:MAG: RtcB family protein [Actinomycetota bacterium]